MGNASSPSLLPHPMKETKKVAERFELELSQSITCSLKHHMLVVASYIGLKYTDGPQIFKSPFPIEDLLSEN